VYVPHLPNGTIQEIECCCGLRTQEVVEGLNRPIGVMPMLLTESTEKASDAGIKWKEAAFFYAEASLMEMARNPRLFME
jgi:hypothetical protein